MIGRPQPSISLQELRAVVAHVRALQPESRRPSRARILAYAAFLVILLGSVRAETPRAYLPSSLNPIEESRMRTLQSLGVVSSFAIASVATAQNAVQWRVEDGGNGHWYAAMVLPGAGLNWENARTFAQSRGADLASLETALESAFAGPLVNTSQFSGAWIGLYQPGSACEPDCGWTWVSGASLSDQNWSQGEPNNLGGGFGDEDHGLMAGTGWGCGSACWGKWVDWPGTTTLKAPIALVEWSADCNSDGIVDFGQIISGELADLDANNIPDCCEGGISCNCVGDTNNDHRVDGADIAFILAGWGQSAAKFPNADCNHDGLIDGADLALVLGSWGACP